MTFPTTDILDTFNRANQNPIPGWTDLSFGLQVLSNQAAGENASSNFAYWNAGSFGPDAEAYVTLSTKPANGEQVGVYVRMKETGAYGTMDGYGVLLTAQAGSDTLVIQRVDNGVPTTLGATINQEFNAGDKLGISVVGSTLTAWRWDGSSWTSLGTRTDSTYPAVGALALATLGTSARLDNFGGGTYVPPLPPPSDTIWTIAIDWDRNGDYTGDEDNVTSRVITADWFLGMKRAYQGTADDSLLRLTLTNADKKYSPENTASPLYGKIAPFRTVRVQSDDGTGTAGGQPRTHWIGWIEKVEPSVNQNGERIVRITAAGPMQFFKAAETSIAIQENQRTDQIVDQLIREVVIPPALSKGWILGMVGYGELGAATWLPVTDLFKALDQGVVTLMLAGDNWITRGSDTQDTFNVYRALADMAAAERGCFLFDRDGKATFWNRLHLQDDIPSSLTLDNTMKDLEYAYAGLDDFKNEIVVTCHPRTLSNVDTEVLWELTSTVKIKAGETKNIGVKFRDESDGKNRIGAKDVTVTDIVFQKGSATITPEIKANSTNLKIVNSGTTDAVLKTCIVRGRKITDYGRMEANKQDSASIILYGRRTMKMNLPSVDNLDYAEQIAGYELQRRKNPRGLVNQVMLASHATKHSSNHAQQLARTIGETLTLTEAQTGHSAKRYVIIGESHRLTKEVPTLETTWYLEPIIQSNFPWKLGIDGRSELGQTTPLAF